MGLIYFTYAVYLTLTYLRPGIDVAKLAEAEKNCVRFPHRVLQQQGLSDCQMIHRKLHKKACKEHTAELKDEKLYNQGNEMKFCPLYLSTCNPMPMFGNLKFRALLHEDGCALPRSKGGWTKPTHSAAHLRPPENSEEALEAIQKRVDARDPAA